MAAAPWIAKRTLSAPVECVGRSHKRMESRPAMTARPDVVYVLPDKVGGYALNTADFTLNGGTHLLVEYNLNGSGKNRGWHEAMTIIPFTELDGDRGRPD